MDKDDLRRQIKDDTEQWGKLFYSGHATESMLSSFAERIAVLWRHLARWPDDNA